MNPLVPADVDLRDMPLMTIDTQLLLRSDFIALATGDEFKAAILLWCKSWMQTPAGSLPNDDQILAYWCCMTKAKWQKVRKRALHGWFECSDGRLYHPVMAEHVGMAWDTASKRSLAIQSTIEKGEACHA